MAAFTSTASAISQTVPAAKKKRKRCSTKKRRVRKSPKPAKPPRSLAKKRWKRRNPKRKSRQKNPSRRKPPPFPEVRSENPVDFVAQFPLLSLPPEPPSLLGSCERARQVTHVRHHPRENLYPLWSHDRRWHHRDSERQNRQCRSRRRSPRRRPGDRRQGPAGLSRPVRSHHTNGFARDRRG